MTDLTEREGFCTIHGVLMDWVPNDANPEGSYWYCEGCYEDEENHFLEPGWDEIDGADEYPSEEQDENDFCPHCGKEYEDWSDYGCPSCDKRVLDL